MLRAKRTVALQALKEFSTPGLASISANYVLEGSSIAVPENCYQGWLLPTPSIPASAGLCHVVLSINTTESSSTALDIWLPDEWNGRLLSTGTGGLSGCVDFPSVSYGASMGFAAIGTDAGHRGGSGAPMLHHSEILADFAWRSIHVEAVVGKQLTAHYYNSPAKHSYYMGCSQGGRQGFRAAEQFPDDFDGIVAGHPVLNVLGLAGWFGLASEPFMPGKPGAMTPADWALVHEETLKQCDALDGKLDRTIAYPDECKFRPEALLCSKYRQQPCLNGSQVDGLRKLYQPMYLESGELIYPRFDPGAENAGPVFNLTFGGTFSFLFVEGFRYIVYDDETWDPNTFSVADVEYAIKANPSDIATWTGDLRKFKQRGGKMFTYHGTTDTLVPSGISSLQYKMTAAATGRQNMDDWYALYLVPGMDHCWNLGSSAAGAWRFGQLGAIPEPRAAQNTSNYNALLAVVDWVEKDQPPRHFFGATDSGETRELCGYPKKGHWINGKWVCMRA